jgi:predicted dinucleotide-binding enzyme
MPLAVDTERTFSEVVAELVFGTRLVKAFSFTP